MEVKETGKYKLLADWSSRGSRSVSEFKAGNILEITQIDRDGKKVIGPQFEDWEPWNIPVEPFNYIAAPDRAEIAAAAQPVIDVGPALDKLGVKYPHLVAEVWVRVKPGGSTTFCANVKADDTTHYSVWTFSPDAAVTSVIEKAGDQNPETVRVAKLAALQKEQEKLESELAQLRGLPEIKPITTKLAEVE